jgi:hypothetical protein
LIDRQPYINIRDLLDARGTVRVNHKHLVLWLHLAVQVHEEFARIRLVDGPVADALVLRDDLAVALVADDGDLCRAASLVFLRLLRITINNRRKSEKKKGGGKKRSKGTEG